MYNASHSMLRDVTAQCLATQIFSVVTSAWFLRLLCNAMSNCLRGYEATAGARRRGNLSKLSNTSLSHQSKTFLKPGAQTISKIGSVHPPALPLCHFFLSLLHFPSQGSLLEARESSGAHGQATKRISKSNKIM